MMSVSGGWFFVVASEAITVSGTTILLPGIGSYIATAIDQKDLLAIFYAVGVMLVTILLYDQLLFRPLLAWSHKFRNELEGDVEIDRPWFLITLQRARFFELVSFVSGWIWKMLTFAIDWVTPARVGGIVREQEQRPWVDWTFNAVFTLAALYAAWELVDFIGTGVGWAEVSTVFGLGLITAIRVLILIVVASVIWVPIGVWIGLRPNVAATVQPIIQFLAAFPANLFFPIFVLGILKFHLNVEIWISPLMILGTQWYILFNVIGGTMALPSDIHYAASNLRVQSWLWWRRVILPGIFPAYVTGALTAAGGSWNASIVSEVVKWGDDKLTATGIGAYIADYTEAGDFPRIALGVGVLCIYVLLLNRLFWRRLYNLAAEKLRMD
jgi:NitT/TauT family transport system permease protein